MASLPCNLPTIVVTGEVTSSSNTAHIDIERFGARSLPDSSSEPAISDAHQVEGPFLSYSLDAHFQSSHFSYDNAFNGATFRASSQRSFSRESSPASIFSNFGAEESPSSTYNHVASPFLSLSPLSLSDPRIISPGSSQEPLNEGSIQMTLRDTASPISQCDNGIGSPLRPRRYSDGLWGGFPASHHGRRPQLDQLHSPFIVQNPNVGSNNGLGLTFGDGYPGDTPAPEMFFVGQGQISSYPHAPLSPISPFSPDARTRPSQALPPLGMDTSNEPSFGPSFAPENHTEDWAYFPSLSSFGPSTQGMDARASEVPGGPYYAPESYPEDGIYVPSRPGCVFPPTGVDVDRGFSGGPYFAPASYREGGVHFPSQSSRGFRPQGVDVGHGLFGGPYSASESYPEDGSHFLSRSSRDLPPQVVDVDHGFSDGPCSAPASFTEDGTHLPGRSSCNLPLPGVDASNGLSNGPYSSPASFVEGKGHFPSNSLPSHTSTPSTFRSFFEDETRDPMNDTVPAASSSSAVPCWSGDTTVLLSSHKKTVSTPKIRKASEKRRKKPAKFGCSVCGNTFTEKHNLINHFNSHRGVKSHPCGGCPSVFGVKSSLTRHRKICKQTKLS